MQNGSNQSLPVRRTYRTQADPSRLQQQKGIRCFCYRYWTSSSSVLVCIGGFIPFAYVDNVSLRLFGFKWRHQRGIRWSLFVIYIYIYIFFSIFRFEVHVFFFIRAETKLITSSCVINWRIRNFAYLYYKHTDCQWLFRDLKTAQRMCWVH